MMTNGGSTDDFVTGWLELVGPIGRFLDERGIHLCRSHMLRLVAELLSAAKNILSKEVGQIQGTMISSASTLKRRQSSITHSQAFELRAYCQAAVNRGSRA
jgi:hypothetical protein